MVQNRRSSCSSWTESVWSSFGRTFMGKAIWENPIETWLGENSKLGMSLCTPKKKIILIFVCGWNKIGWKETKYSSDVENTQQRSWFGRTNIFLWSCFLGLHSKTMWNKQRYCWQLQNHVWITNFRRWTEKLPYSENLRVSSWSYDMEGHAKKCVERYCELANKTTQQLYKVSTPCIDDHLFKEEKIKSVGELSWQTPESIHIVHSSHMWIQTVLLCGWYCKTMQAGTVSRLRFRGRSWGLKIYFWRNIVHFWKSYICSNKLDV